MKPIICKCMFLLLMFVAPSLCSAELPDGLMIDDGRITGTVTAIFAKGSEQETAQTLLMDCAVPEAA